MSKYGWTSWGWYTPSGPGFEGEQEPLRRWKWMGRQDVFVETNDDTVLLFLSSALREWR
jgi:hypothetical protein